MSRAAQCIDCRHRLLNHERGRLCKPRIYPPRDAADRDWGWKRRCEDFEPCLELAPPEVPAIPRAGRG